VKRMFLNNLIILALLNFPLDAIWAAISRSRCARFSR